MNGCLVTNKVDFWMKFQKLVDDSVPMGVLKGSTYLKNSIKQLIEDARTSAQPESQLALLKSALEEFYNAPNAYGRFIGTLFPLGDALVLFNPKYDQTLDDNKTVSSTYEETAKSSRITRSRNFLDSYFKEAPNAKLYFQRSLKNDMVETFLVRRSGDNPMYFTSQEEMNKNVRDYKQELLDRVFAYFRNDQFLINLVQDLPSTMYDESGNYTGVIGTIKATIDSRLSPEMFTSQVKNLDQYYKEYRDGDKLIKESAKRFLDAYNAWIMLQNFDTLVTDSFGSIIKVSPSSFNRHDYDKHKYEIKGRATNMWSNWVDSDDIANMSEVISDVTQALIDTSKMYKWGSEEAFTDRYVSFHDFNYVIGWIKRSAFDQKNDKIVIQELDNIKNVSLDTKRILFEILSWNRTNGNYIRDERGELLKNSTGVVYREPRNVTWKQLLSRINENPQKYLHAVFEILCKTNILDKFSVDDYQKNLIWSFYKEVFGGDGSGDGVAIHNNSRSLYRLHSISKQDNVYQIITQVAASTFPEDYLQYYEKQDGAISTRLLQDFAIEEIKRGLLEDIQQTSSTLSQEHYSRFGISINPVKNDPNFLESVKVRLPISPNLTFNMDISVNNINISEYTPEKWDLIWKSNVFQNFIKEILGINFDSDPDLKAAYMELVKSPYGAVQDISKIAGRVIFNAVVNNDFVPKHPAALKEFNALYKFINSQYGKDLATHYKSGVVKDTGYIPVLPVNLKDAALGNLAMAKAINSNLLAAAQSKTGEGTSLANFTLSRMRNFYQNQIEMQCKKDLSATKDMSFVVNTNGLFEGILSRRELKTLNVNQQSTQFSDKQSFQLSFMNDFIAGFVPNPSNNTHLKNGHVSFLPTVNSDKSQIDGLLVNLNAKTRIPNGRGGFKTYMELTDSEIEQEMVSEFKPMYDRIITNINTELAKVCSLLPNFSSVQSKLVGQSVLIQNQLLLQAINDAFANDTSLGKKPKARITQGLHNLITTYNQTHRRNPIMLSTQVHYIFDDNGLLTNNKTLEALWGRFNPDSDVATKQRLAELYKNESDFLAYMSRNGLSDPSSVRSFFKYKEHLTVKDLLEIGFEVPLRGSNEVVRHEQPEVQFLRGDAVFTNDQLNDPNYAHLIALNNEMRNWVDANGTMIIAKGLIDGKVVSIKTVDQLQKASNLQLHPMLSKLNRLDYLCTQQYTISTVGSHYVHKGGANTGSILVEEARRWLASNKRNVAATSTVHLFQNKQLDGAPSTYNVAIIDDVYFDLYNVMGDMYLEGHAPLDGGMFVNAWMSDLENNSLAGEKAGLDKKQFGTFYSELYGAGGIVKTAGFAATNARMRRQKAWQSLQKNMSNIPWTKEHSGPNGEDVLETLDITKDYLGRSIDYKQAINDQPIMYKRIAHDGSGEMAAYKLLDVKSLGNNQYQIFEVEIDAYGAEIGSVINRTETINTNWDLYTKLFGGWLSLEVGSDNKLTWSENSNKLMVYAINNVGYRKNNDHILEEDFGQFGETASQELTQHMNNVETGLDQDDVWQPLKYSDIHYTPNIGAIKSLQFNLNPDGEAVLTSNVPLNFMTMRLAQLGIQLDKEHHADAAEVSMPTQIIQACTNRSFTVEYAKEIYTALETLTRQATQSFVEGVSDIIQGESPDKLVESVTKLILDRLIQQSGDDTTVNIIMKDLLEKAEQGKEITFADDIKGKIPWSDPTISNKLFSELSTTLTNIAVKMKFAGTLSVICPTERVEKMYGDYMLSSFTKVYGDNGSTRTAPTESVLEAYQNSVIEGNETDSSGNNLLIYDNLRDIPPVENELPEDYTIRLKDKLSIREKLSKVAKLKTQHNYVIKFSDDSTENITINTPEDYYRIKNLVRFGKRDGNLGIEVSQIYENVIDGRALGAYNVRFSDSIHGFDFQLFDLDSVNLLFKLNNLWTGGEKRNKAIKGYTLFQSLNPIQQQTILNQVFRSTAFNSDEIYAAASEEFFKLIDSEIKAGKVTQVAIPRFDGNFINNFEAVYPGKLIDFITILHAVAKPRVHKVMQSDLFKLSSNYKGSDRRVCVNGGLITPVNIETEAYETILPQVYQTVFGLQEGDDVQEILKDKDFFVKRGLSRFACKLDHSLYDYELKAFNGNHYYVLDASKGIPDGLEVMPIFIKNMRGKQYRVDSDGQIMYELSSDKDIVCRIGDVQIIVSKNPMFYVQNLNYNTLKVSPKRVTQESYEKLIESLKQSKRVNSKNFIKAISNPDGTLFDLKTFKEYNTAIDSLTYDNVTYLSALKDFKSVAQICRILLQNGRELHTSFETSLQMIAGRIPAQSQQSFMTQKVIGFDSSGLNTAMVSTFQLFLQGSDLDIDAVTMLGYEFDHSGKFVGWSPYFDLKNKETFEASKLLPLPTGQIKSINATKKAPNNFFEVYDKYFGTLFKTIVLPNGNNKFKTKNGVLELQMDIATPEGMALLAEFLRDFNKYGINIQANAVESEDGVLLDIDEGFHLKKDAQGNVIGEWNLFKRVAQGGLIGARPEQMYAMAQQLLDFANTHNNYLNIAEEHLRDKLTKNYVVHYMYKVAEAPCNQTEAQVGLDVSTRDVKFEAAHSAMANASDSYAPGSAITKFKSVGEGQVGKSCVGIGAVGIKANSTTQFYLSEILNNGSEWDRDKLLFKHYVFIGGKMYRGFANMFTDKQFSEIEMNKLQNVLEYINSLDSPDQVTQDVAVNIASLLSIAVDNAKDLALAKINSGPKMMGMYAYGLTLGIPIKQLVSIINSPEGRVLTSLTEGSYINNDSTAFKTLDAIKKLDGQIGGDLNKYTYFCKDSSGKIIKSKSHKNIRINNKSITIATPQDALLGFMYSHYQKWVQQVNNKRQGEPLRVATTLGGMLEQLLKFNAFEQIYLKAQPDIRAFYTDILVTQGTSDSVANWSASLAQMVDYIRKIQTNINRFNTPIGRDLRTLAQGAEEMRVLGSILSINKGLKSSMSEAETFIDTIENLIYDRKNNMGITPTDADRIDFHKFMTDEEYQREKIDAYEKVKHSVNILHLISKVPHFNAYLKTQMIPTAFFMTSSIKYRTIHKYRQNAKLNTSDKPQSLFKLLGIDGTREQESAIKGLENLIQFKLLTRWMYDKKLKLKIPAGFKYFTKQRDLTSNPNSELEINLYSYEGLATFKKYMEEVIIPNLKDSPEFTQNEFVKNLVKIAYNKTPVHSSVTTYSLQGDLMTKQGRQAELNAKMFADFQHLAGIRFQPDQGIPSLADAFYLYAQYCYMGKKGKKSLMTLFDNTASRGSLAQSFTNHIANMDVDGEITCSPEELIIWCAPFGNQHLRATYGYVSSNRTIGIFLKKKVETNNKKQNDDMGYEQDDQDYIEEAFDDLEGLFRYKPENFGVYKSEYSTMYDRLTKNHFLVPSTSEKVSEIQTMDMTILGATGTVDFKVANDMVREFIPSQSLLDAVQARIASGEITKFKDVNEFINAVQSTLSNIHIPYKVSLYTDSKREINFGILQTIVDQLINC